MTSENTGYGSKSFRSYLEHIVSTNRDNLRLGVSQILLDETEDQKMLMEFVDDLFQYGCISGIVGHLVYYNDTYEFYDKYYRDIEDLREQNEEELGSPMKIKGDLKNDLAWFAFERTTFRLLNEWESTR